MVIVIMGVSGSGKTTVGSALARAVGGRFYDADDFHPRSNVEKMSRGVPLADADREPWLAALREAIDRWLPEPETTVLACSALTARSRERLGTDRPGFGLVYLKGPEALIGERMRARKGRHFMPPELLASQFGILEPPADAVTLDVGAPVEALVERIRAAWDL